MHFNKIERCIYYLFHLININFKRHTYAHKQFKKKFINIWIKKQINLKFMLLSLCVCVCVCVCVCYLTIFTYKKD